jgi:polyferredoxin
LLFIDFTGLIPETIYKSIVFFQFFPSFLNFTSILAFSASGFIFIIILTFLYGRVYCSFICPLGFLQDIIIFTSKKIRRLKQYRYRYLRSFRLIRYGFLGLFMTGLLSGYTLILSVLDPYSIYGRIASGVFRKSIVETNNLIVSVFQKINVYSLYHVDLKPNTGLCLLFHCFFYL